MTGKEPDRFPDTRWSLIGRARGEDEESRTGLEEWCRCYRRPVVEYILATGVPPAEAEDLAHDFFEKLFERGAGSILPERLEGRFRMYLQRMLRNHLTDHWRRVGRQKRGGDLARVDWEKVEPLVKEGAGAEEAFARSWALTVIAEASRRLEEEMTRAGKGKFLAAVGDLLDGRERSVDRAALAEQFGLSEGAFRVALHRLRGRLRELVEEEVRQTVGDEESFQEEIRYLLAIWS